MNDTFIYLRKSREDTDKKDTLENHRKILIDLCNKNNWSYEIFEEIKSSNSLENRTEIKRMLQLIEQGKCKRVVVMALDRLSRDKTDSAKIEEILIKNNIELVTPDRVFNWDNESDFMLSDFESLIARSEYRLIKKRLAIGKQVKAEQGKLVNGEPPMGYKIDKNINKVVIDKEKAIIYRWIVDNFLTGNYSTHTLATEFNKYYLGNRGKKANNSRIYKILSNRFYLGEVKHKNKWYKGEHEPLITIEEYNKIINQLKGKSKIPNRKGYRQIKRLSGLCKCGLCGHTLTVTKQQDKYFLRCWYVDHDGNRCKNKQINENIVIENINIAILDHIHAIQEILNNRDINSQLNSKNSIYANLERLKAMLKNIDKKESNIKDLAINGILTISETKERLEQLKEERENINKSIDKLNNSYKSIEDLKIQYDRFINMYDTLQGDINTEIYNQVLRGSINKITLTRANKEEIEIDINFI